MSKQELPDNKWDELQKKIEKSRKDTEDIDPMKHILNKMSVSSGGERFYDDERKDEIINKGE